jgi:hypothetical protein
VVRRRWSFLVLLLLAGCGPSLPGTLVGESAHFRLFVDPDLDPGTFSAAGKVQPALGALETDWADKQTMLQMPEGKQKIDYHLLTSQHLSDACGFPEFESSPYVSVDQAGCEATGTLQVAAAYLPHQHELIHAYMDLITSGTLSVPLVVEGTAQSIGCGTTTGTDLAYDVPWQQAMSESAEDPAQDAYSEGGLLARYLIRTQGIDAWVRYYRQAPQRRDPALFAENFSAFWNMSIDDVWTAMHVVQPGAASTDETICPCALSALPTDGQPIPSDVTHPYWPIGDTQGASLGMTGPGVPTAIRVHDCAGVGPVLRTDDTVINDPANLPDATVAIVQLADGRSHYVLAPIATASVGGYLAGSCAGTTPYALPADFLSGQGDVSLLFSPMPAQDVRVYLQLQMPFAAQITPVGVGICDNCDDFTPGPCAFLPLPSPSPFAAGPLDVAVLPSQLPQGFATPYGTGTILHFTN